MPITPQQISQSLLAAANRAREQAIADPRVGESDKTAARNGWIPGEFRNALRDFRFSGGDAQRITSMSNEQLARTMARLIVAQNPDQNENSQYQQLLSAYNINGRRVREAKNMLISGIGESPFRPLAQFTNISDFERALQNFPEVQNFVGFANTLESEGLIPRGETVSQRLGFLAPENFSLDAQVAREEAQVQADRARVQAPAQSQAERAGRIPTTIREGANGWEIVDTRDNSVVDTVPFGSNRDVALTQALARQTQISSGSTPSLAGRPDVFAVEPTPQERAAGIEPIVPQEGVAPVAPRVATGEEIASLQAETLPTPAVERGLTPAPEGQPPTPVPVPTGETAIPPVSTTPPETGAGETESTPEDQITASVEKIVGSKEEEAKAENPDLIVTPEMRAVWFQEAIDELRQNRGIAEIIRNTEFDLGQSLNRLIEDVKFRELETLNQFRQDFRNQQVSQRERGFLFGGIREQEEKQLADVTNLSLAQQGRTLERGVQDISQGFERTFGTTGGRFGGGGALGVASQLGSIQGVSRVIPGSPVIKAGEATPGFVISGGQFGSFNRGLEEEARRRALEKQNAFETQFSLARTF